MRNDVIMNLKSMPPVFPMDSTGYGYYTSYSTKHKNTGPLTFPPAPEKDKPVAVEVVAKTNTIAKLPAITKPQTVKFLHWDGQKLASNQENLYRAGPDPKVETQQNSAFDFGYNTGGQQQRYVIAATVNPYRDYGNFVRDCYHLNPGQFRFNVQPTPDMLMLAEALSNGDLRQVKLLAARLPNAQAQVNYTILFPIVPADQREMFTQPTELVRPPIGTSVNGTVAAPTRPSIYIAPTKTRYLRRRLNRRPKPIMRPIIGLTTTTSTTETPPAMTTAAAVTTQQAAMPTTTDSQWEPMRQPATPQRRRLVYRRQSWHG